MMFGGIGRGSLLVVCCVVLCACAGERSADDHIRRGDEFLAANKNAEAVVSYRNAVRLDQRNGTAHYKLGVALKQGGDIRAAAGAFIAAADLLPERNDVQLEGIRAYLATGRFEDARAKAEALIRKDPNNVDAHILRGHATAGLKDLSTSQKDLEAALKINPQHEEALINLASLQLVRGEREAAEAAYKQAVSVHPRSIGAQLALANFYSVSGRLPEAEKLLHTVLEQDPGNVPANQGLARLYLATRRAPAAEAPLRKVADESSDVAVKLILADYYAAQNRPEDALRTLEPLTQDAAAAAAARARIAGIEYQRGQRDRAHALIDELIASEKNKGQVLTVKAGWLLREGKIDEAIAMARNATVAEPNFDDAHFVLGSALLAQHHTSEAVRALNEALRLNPSAVNAQVELAKVHLAMGQTDDSLKFAQQAIKNQPRNGNARFAFATALLKSGEVKRAEEEVALLLPVASDRADVLVLSGRISLKKGDHAAARQAFEKAIQVDPVSVDALEELVKFDTREKQPARAKARVDAALAKAPADPALLVLAARVYNSAGDPAGAEATLKRAIQLDPSSTLAFNTLGQLYVSQNRLDDARREYDELSKQRPDHIGAHTMVAMILQVQNQEAEARKRYEQILSIDRRAAVANNNLAYMYAESGTNLDIALAMAQTAKETSPDDADINDTLGWIYVKRGLPSMAIDPLRQAIEKDPTNPTVHYHLGVAYAKAGNNPAARTALDGAFRLAPSFPGSDDARVLLDGLKR